MAKITMLVPFDGSLSMAQFVKEEFSHLPDLEVLGTDSGLDDVSLYWHIEHHMGLVLDKAAEIEKKGDCDALIIGCFGDPGLVALRQAISIPVVGPGQASLCTALMLGDKIGVVVPQRDLVFVTEKTIHAYQFTDHVVGVRSAEESVPDAVLSRPDESVSKMADICLGLIHENDADVLVFGCIGFSWMVDQVRELLAGEGLKTPIIEPGITGYKAAKMLVELNLNQDRRRLAASI